MLRFPLFAASLALVLATPAFAHDTAPDNISTLQRHALPNVPGKQGLMIRVDYAPGQSSAAHVHSGAVFAYVLEGAVISQLQGQPAITYKAGDSWYEAPNTPHLVSRNASDQQPAKLLVWMLLDDQAPVLTPLKR